MAVGAVAAASGAAGAGTADAASLGICAAVTPAAPECGMVDGTGTNGLSVGMGACAAAAKRSVSRAAASGLLSAGEALGARRAIAVAFARCNATESDAIAYSARTAGFSPVSRAAACASRLTTVHASLPRPPSASNTSGMNSSPAASHCSVVSSYERLRAA